MRKQAASQHRAQARSAGGNASRGVPPRRDGERGGGERLQKLLAAAGLGSRRGIEQWIREGRLQVDGQVATLGMRAAPGADVRLDGRRLRLAAMGGEVLVYHKPTGEVTTRSDPQGRRTVFERLPSPRHGGRWVVVGRLDLNTSGLLLFTTDGALAHRLMHPSSQVEREYLVRVRGQPRPQDLERLRSGVLLADGRASFERLEPLGSGAAGAASGERSDRSHGWYRVTLREGRNREVRRLWEAVGFEVSRLSRVRHGPIELPRQLPAGHYRWLEAAEVARLVAACDASAVASRGPEGDSQGPEGASRGPEGDS